MSDFNLKAVLLEELDYADTPGLNTTNLWPNGRPIPSVENAYFIQDVPVVYFSHLDDPEPDLDRLWKLYRNVWSQSKVPLLYVILSQEIRIYNGYTEPPQTPEELDTGDRLLIRLEQLTNIESARQEISSKLNGYRRIYLETGAFWSTETGQRINREKRADQRLLDAMGQVRRHLLADGKLPEDIAYALLGRSIFIRYLQDRGILNEEWISLLTDGQAKDYIGALENKDMTYRLFKGLSQRFNGDLFPVDEEEKKVEQTHLNLLRDFLNGHNLDTGQMSFWPYDFTHIPIELISGIYDTFLSGEERKKLGAYYTPLPLVDFVVEETLPLEKTHQGMTVLDPACGSGIFLVRAYQRLVEAWKREHNDISLAKQLGDILKQSIFGVDIKVNAVQIAAFSLYLAMLDYLSNEEIADERFRFPSLKNTNLIAADFFSQEVEQRFVGRKFDRVIGNLPWGKGSLRGDAVRWTKEHGHQIGGKQIVQAFLQRAPNFCTNEGELALLAPVKSTILLTSATHQAFREQFFRTYHVRAVVNFAALVYELFLDSLSPVVALFYQPNPPPLQEKLVYGVPKPSPLSQHLGAIVLDTTEVRYLDREDLATDPVLWKIALWGSPRDAAIIRYLQFLPTLQERATQLGWTVDVEEERNEAKKKDIPQGFIVGNKKKEALWLEGMPCVDTDRFRSYLVEVHGVIKESHFERPRTREIYRGPIVLIHRSTSEAAFFEGKEVAYRDKISGVPGKLGQESLLKWLTAYINSSLSRYYHFLTSTSWAVERGTIIHEEYKQMPLLIPDQQDPRFQQVLYYFDQIVSLYQEKNMVLGGSREEVIQQLRNAIDVLIFDLYDLSSIERQFVQDMVEYGIGFFQWAKRKQRKLNDAKANPIKRPAIQMLVRYAEAFIETVADLLRYQNQTLNAIVYQDGAPLNVVEFELVSVAEAKKVRTIEESKTLRDLLRKLDRVLLEQHTPTLYQRHHVRIYDGLNFYVARPAERRFWTTSQARIDADSFLGEMLARSKRETGVSY